MRKDQLNSIHKFSFIYFFYKFHLNEKKNYAVITTDVTSVARIITRIITLLF